jgi:hypothetical protein
MGLEIVMEWTCDFSTLGFSHLARSKRQRIIIEIIDGDATKGFDLCV